MEAAPRISFVTGNEKKIVEVQDILGQNVKLKMGSVCSAPEIQGSIEEIARWKCVEASRQIEGPVITEDTALCFDALNGLPGPYIKSFLEDVGLEGLNKMLQGFDNTAAKAICTVAYMSSPDAEPILFQGIVKGRIVMPRGPLNFGWDPIFQPDHESNLTYAEMPKEIKNQISHRYLAFTKLREYLQHE